MQSYLRRGCLGTRVMRLRVLMCTVSLSRASPVWSFCPMPGLVKGPDPWRKLWGLALSLCWSASSGPLLPAVQDNHPSSRTALCLGLAPWKVPQLKPEPHWCEAPHIFPPLGFSFHGGCPPGSSPAPGPEEERREPGVSLSTSVLPPWCQSPGEEGRRAAVSGEGAFSVS